MPDYSNVRDGAFFDYNSYAQIATGVTSYTAPEDGFIYVTGRNIGSYQTLSININGHRVAADRNAYNDGNYPASVHAVVGKGDVITISTAENIYFAPAKGTKRPSGYCIKY